MTAPDPKPSDRYDWEDLVDMTLEQKEALPAKHHWPFFDSLGEPNAWLCTVCWDEGTVTGWPCAAATKGGLELADELGLKATR